MVGLISSIGKARLTGVRLQDRYPNHTLKLDFENGSAPSQELLYDLLRPVSPPVCPL